MAFDAGKIEASLDLDRSPFQRNLREAKAEARQFADEKYAAKLDADTGQALAKVIDIRDRLDRLSAKRVTPLLSVDNAAGLVKLVDFNDRLDALRAKVATARAEVDDDAARTKLDALDIQLRRVGTITSRPRVTVEGVQRANLRVDELGLKLAALDRAGGGGSRGGGLLGRLAAFGRGGFFGGMGLLGVAGGSAAIPFGIGAAGLGAGFLTPTVAGLGGLGLFGGAATGALRRVSDVEDKLNALNQRIANTPATKPAGDPQQIAAAQARLSAAQTRLTQVQNSDTGTPAQIAAAHASVLSAQASVSNAQGGGANPEHARLIKQRQQLLDQLTPAERRAAEGIEKFEHAWKHFQRELEPETFRLLATGTDIFTKGLHLLLPMTKAVGDEVDNLAVRADRALSKPFWRHFFGDFLTREAPRAVDTLGTVLGNVVSGFAHLSEDFAPLGHRLEDDVIRWSGIFDRWTQGSGPGEFMALVERDGPIAAQALAALADGLGGLAAGLEPIGRVELQALTPILHFIGELGEQHPEVITALGVAYLTVATGLKAIGAVNNLQRAFGTAESGFAGMRRGALLTAGAIGAFEIGRHTDHSSGGLVEAGLGGALTGLAAGLLTFGPEGAVVGAFVGGLGAIVTNILSGRTALKSMTDQVDALAGSLQNAIKLDRGLIGHNVRREVETQLTTNPDFQKPGIGGLTFLQTLTKYGVTEDQLLQYVRSGFKKESPQIHRVLADADKSGNTTFINQFSELMHAILEALGEFRDLNTFREHGGRGGRQRHRGGGRNAPAGNDRQHAYAPGHATVYDLRGSTFVGVQHPHDLERKLRAKQRLSSLGPGISVDNANRIG